MKGSSKVIRMLPCAKCGGYTVGRDKCKCVKFVPSKYVRISHG